MVLLTSSQVSVAISSCIVILCTTALFLSGYAIQQRTLRDLRRAIRPDPRPSPKIYLPDRFKQSTTELPDGTVVNLDEQEASSGNAGQRKKGDITIEVRPSIPEGGPGGAGGPGGDAQKPLAAEQETTTKKEQQEPNSDTAAEESQDAKNSASKLPEKKDASKQPDAKKEEEPMSRAERRRRIKEEIMELSQGESPMYYQRRLW